MAQIAITVTDPAGNRAEVQIDNYTPVRTALSACVKQLGLPAQLNYHLFPAGTRAKLSAEKTLVAAGVRSGSELTLAPVRDVMFTTVTERLYTEACDFARREAWDAADERFGQLLRVFPDHPDPDGLRGTVPVSENAPAAPPPPVERPQRPVSRPEQPEVLRKPAASKGGCLVVIVTAACLVFGGLRATSAETEPTRLTTDGRLKKHLQYLSVGTPMGRVRSGSRPTPPPTCTPRGARTGSGSRSAAAAAGGRRSTRWRPTGAT